MPYRILQTQFINYSLQINIIEECSKRDSTRTDGVDKSGEYISHFKKTDKITRVICLVIYYGEIPWNGPRSLEEMYVENGLPDLGESNPLHLLDVRHLSKEAKSKRHNVKYLECLYTYLLDEE